MAEIDDWKAGMIASIDAELDRRYEALLTRRQELRALRLLGKIVARDTRRNNWPAADRAEADQFAAIFQQMDALEVQAEAARQRVRNHTGPIPTGEAENVFVRW